MRDPFPPYVILGLTGPACATIKDLALWIHAERHGHGLQLEDHQVRWDNVEGPRATVLVRLMTRSKKVVRELLVSTKGEPAQELAVALRETRAVRREAA